jgi:hypothetical protein
VFISCGGRSAADPETALWAGFARGFRLELSNTRIVTLDLEVKPSESVLEKLAEVLPTLLLSATFNLDLPGHEVEDEYAVRNG